jgi:hypothetical protein
LKNFSKISRINTTTILLILTLVTTSILFIPLVIGDTPTHAFVEVTPNPAGVNQQVTIIMWLDKIDPTTAGPQGSVWQNYEVKITKPDGTSETLGPFTADPAAYAFTLYTPTQVGTYTIDFTFPGQQVTGIGSLIPIPIDEYYEPSSFTTTLTVQQEQISPLPQNSLPTDFWARPIDAQNQEWYTISGNWLGIGGTTFGNTMYNWSGNFNPYTKGPNSAHIVWTKPITHGGLIGGEFGGTTTSNYYTGKSYEPKLTPPVIINGVLYYNEPLPPKNGYYAVDLRTGETLWHHESIGPLTEVGAVGLLGTPSYPGISCGQIFNYRSPNEVGARAYLWFAGTAGPAASGFGAAPFWYLYDAEEGDLILEMENATAGGVRVQGPNGELLYYYIGADWLAMWNSTKAIGTGGTAGTGLWAWRPPTGTKIDWREGIQWNVTVPPVFGQAIHQIDSGKILAITGNIFLPQDWQIEVAYDMWTGQQLWIQNRTTPKGATTFGMMGPFEDEIYAEYDKGALQWRGFSGTTGEQIWGPTEPFSEAWDSQSIEMIGAYGNLYHRTLSGIHTLDMSNGDNLWYFKGDSSGVDWPGFSTLPFLGSDMTIADEKVFVGTGNSHGDPLFRGAKLYAIDAMTGDEVWSINAFIQNTMPIADGYLIAFNGYDNQIYCFGKGQTAITVDAPLTAVPLGSSVVIRGTITDQSTGVRGTPAIADEDMTEWMEYLHMQKPMPMNAKGVEVKLEALDPNFNFYEIGTVTSDASGMYKLMWEPPVPGEYTIIATFEGSDSYWSSYSETAIGVTEAPSPGGPIEPEPTEGFALGTTELAIIAIVIIAVVALVAFWARRKRK